jgi:hypothetical protein
VNPIPAARTVTERFAIVALPFDIKNRDERIPAVPKSKFRTANA